MRITGGILAGRKINTPPGPIRPAMDKMRESVFAIIGNLEGCSFLDVFSGSGGIALEAASRGAEYIEAVEADPIKRSIMLQNVAISPVHIECKFMAAELYVKRAKRPFDWIFLDPPFPYAYKQDLLQRIEKSKLVHEKTKLLIHHPREDNLLASIGKLRLYDQRKYGRSIVNFYRIGSEGL